MGNYLGVNCEFGKMTKETISSCQDFVCSKDADIHSFFHGEFEDQYMSKEENVTNGELFKETRLMYFDLMRLAN